MGTIVDTSKIFYIVDKMIGLVRGITSSLVQSGRPASVVGVTAVQSSHFCRVSTSDDDSWKTASSIYDFTVRDIDGEDICLEKYKSHVCVLVNVASK